MQKDTFTFFGVETSELRADISHLHESWGWILAFGTALLVLGVVACSATALVTLTSVVLIGWLLAIAGGIQCIHAFSIPLLHGFFFSLLAGVVYAIVGVLIIARPAEGAASLTLLMTGFFLISGIYRSIWSLVTRFPNWGWGIFSGGLTTLLGVMIAASWPASSLWVIGMFVGIDLVFSGWSLIMLALAAHASRQKSLSPSTAERDSRFNEDTSRRVS